MDNQIQMTLEEFLKKLKGLSLTVYDETKVITSKRIQKLMGEKPTREKFKREQESLFTPLDWLALLVFIAAFVVSSIHIIARMGEMAGESFNRNTKILTSLGIVISQPFYEFSHQAGYVVLAESSMLLFLVTWRLQTKGKGWITYGKRFRIPIPWHLLSIYLGLALLAMFFVLSSNLSSGLPVLESFMPPIFTIGLGFHIEGLLVELLQRRRALTLRFTEAINLWEKVNEDPINHPQYNDILMREIWDKLSKLPSNKELADCPGGYKLAAVEREMIRDKWTRVAQEERKVEEQLKEEAKDHEVKRGLNELADKVMQAYDEGLEEVFNFSGSVNLKTLKWINAHEGGKEYGPYQRVTLLAAAIRSIANQ